MSCEPEVTVDYSIVNKTDGKLKVRLSGLRNHQGLLEEYDTLLEVDSKVTIYYFSFLGSGYSNPADTITIYDSIQVVRRNMKAKSDFKLLKAWNYSEMTTKWGGGQYTYELRVRNEDF